MSCRLRALRVADLGMVMQWRMLPDVTRYMYTDPQLTMESQRQWYERISKSSNDKVWIIEVLETASPVGLVSLADIDLTHKRCSWAYYLGEASAKGKNLAKIVECNIYDHVFEVLGLHKLWCEVFAFNDRVVGLHKHFGSKLEGVLREHIWKNGEFHDVVRMSILSNEWFARRTSLSYARINVE